MRGVNKVIIVGNLGADPEHKTFANGGAVTNISVATSEQWTDKQTGEKKEATEWHRISLYDRGNYRLADIGAKYLRKGSQVYIEGSLHTRKWQDQNGQDRYTTEIRAESMQMLGSAGGGQGGGDYKQLNSGPAQVDYQNNPNPNQQSYNNQGNQNSFAQGNQNPQQNTFNNQTTDVASTMADTPADDDIPF